jgi:uncharacterized protein (TIGR04255 family)
MQKLPKEISPDPLVSSVVELRFSSDIKSEELLRTYFPILGKNFPNITYSDLPRQLRRSDPKLMHNPEYTFSNSDYSISIGTNMLSFENSGKYHLWANYYKTINSIISKVQESNIVNKIDRVGVRYISLFDPSLKIKEITNIDFNLGYVDFEQTNNFLQTELVKQNIRLVLKIAENGNVTKGQKTFKGLFVDIDASQSSDLPIFNDDTIMNIIDTLHFEEKKLFYDILQEDFLLSLNPRYEG